MIHWSAYAVLLFISVLLPSVWLWGGTIPTSTSTSTATGTAQFAEPLRATDIFAWWSPATTTKRSTNRRHSTETETGAVASQKDLPSQQRSSEAMAVGRMGRLEQPHSAAGDLIHLQAAPSEEPTEAPTVAPSQIGDTNPPTPIPTTSAPTAPTVQPTNQPTVQPSRQPTREPTTQPSQQPTSYPSRPTLAPTSAPTYLKVRVSACFERRGSGCVVALGPPVC